MTYQIIKSYFYVLLPIGASALLMLIAGLYWIFKPKGNVRLEDISAIAGDDLIATQLDLARAYIETNNSELATPILHQVAQRGTDTQRQEAKELLASVQ